MSEAWKVRRANELHHIAMSHVVVQIRNLCIPRSYRFAESAFDGIFWRDQALPPSHSPYHNSRTDTLNIELQFGGALKEQEALCFR